MKIIRRFVLTCLITGLCGLMPVIAGGAEPAYRIGPDDVLAISVWDNKELDQLVFVRPDGKISLPLAGEIQAAGLTVAELAATLSDIYVKYIERVHVTIAVREIRSRSVFFVGGVGKPGPMQLTQSLTLLQAISLVGGVQPGADVESAYVIRGDRRIPVDFARLMQRGDPAQNVKLEVGDTIVVPTATTVYVQGEVKTPGLVKFSNDLTMVKAIAHSGGFTALAAPSRVTLLRVDGEKKESVRVNVSEMMAKPEAAADVPLRPNDIIIVPQRLF